LESGNWEKKDHLERAPKKKGGLESGRGHVKGAAPSTIQIKKKATGVTQKKKKKRGAVLRKKKGEGPGWGETNSTKSGTFPSARKYTGKGPKGGGTEKLKKIKQEAWGKKKKLHLNYEGSVNSNTEKGQEERRKKNFKPTTIGGH